MSENLTGKTYGSLFVIRLQSIDESSRRRWRCRCTCGKECDVLESHLKSGHTKSCGCLKIKLGQANAVNLSGQRFGRLVALEPTERRSKTSVVWKCQCDCGTISYCDAETLNRGKARSCGCLQEEQRKENMKNHIHFVDGTCIEKIAAQKETAANTSGHRGVTRRANGTWRAELTFRKKRYNLGTYATFEEAVQARVEGEELYIGTYLKEYYRNQMKETEDSPESNQIKIKNTH